MTERTHPEPSGADDDAVEGELDPLPELVPVAPAPDGVVVPKPVFYAWVFVTTLALLLGASWAAPAIASWQPGEQGADGLQSLLNRLAAGEIADADELFTPESLEQVEQSGLVAGGVDGGYRLESALVGTPEAREAFAAQTRFTVEGVEPREFGSPTGTYDGRYVVTAITTFAVNGEPHESGTSLAVGVERSSDVRDNAWLISSVTVRDAWSSLPASPPNGFVGATQGALLEACPAGYMGAIHTFAYNTDGVRDCVLPGATLPAAVQELVDAPDRAERFSSDDLTYELTASPYLVHDRFGVTGPFTELRMTFDEVEWLVVFVPLADGSGRIAAVIPEG